MKNDNHDLEALKKELTASESIPGLYLTKSGDRYLPCYSTEDWKLVNWRIIPAYKKRSFYIKHHRLGMFSYIGVIDKSKPVAIYDSYEEAVKAFIAFGITAFFSISRIGNRKLRRLLESKGFTIVLADMLTASGEPASVLINKDENIKDAIETKPILDIAPTSIIDNVPDNEESPIGKVFNGEQMSEQLFSDDFIVRDIIPEGELLGFIYGPSGSGKTFILLDMFLFVASGFPSWHGISINRAKILYVAGESYKAINQRMASFKKEYGITYKEYFYTYFLDVPLSLKEGYELLQQKIDSGEVPFKPDVIIFDTLNSFYIEDENKADSASIFKATRLVPLQKKYHSNILVVSHSTKYNDEEMRGTTAFKALSDYMILVHRDSEKVKDILVGITKNRMGEEIDVMMRCRIKKIRLDTWQPDRDGLIPKGGIIECIENLASGVEPLEDKKAIARLDILKKAIVEVGEKCISGDWFITGDAFRLYLKDHGYSENDIKKTFCYSDNKFFPELMEKLYVKVERAGEDERRKIERIIILPPELNKKIDEMHAEWFKNANKASKSSSKMDNQKLPEEPPTP